MHLISFNVSFYVYQDYFCTFAKITLAKAFCTWRFYWGFGGIRSLLCCLPALSTNCICILDVPVFKILRLYPHQYFLVINFITGSSAFCLKDREFAFFLDYATATQILSLSSSFFHVLCVDSWKKKTRLWGHNMTIFLQYTTWSTIINAHRTRMVPFPKDKLM